MTEIIGSTLGSTLGYKEQNKIKNYGFFLKELLSHVKIKKLNTDVFLKNHKFISFLSLINEDIDNLSLDLIKYGYHFKKSFLSDNEELCIYLRKNKKNIKSGNLLVGFLYDGLVITSIIFAEENSIDSHIRDNIERTLRDIDGSLIKKT